MTGVLETLFKYRKVIGNEAINELFFLADKLKDKTFQHINSTSVGGGVAEILSRMVPFMKELGLTVYWDIIKGGEEFFGVTKAFHNALHGGKVRLAKKMLHIYEENTRFNLEYARLNGDIIIIHDPQPMGLIKAKKRASAKWVWRCHIDVSQPNKRVWKYIEPLAKQYDATIFSAPFFAKQLPVRQFLIPPSIDPFSDKNKYLKPDLVRSIVENYGIDTKRPIITQVSRFDRLKDPVGVIEAYKIVKKSMDCQLILAGGGAADDPEADIVFNEMKERAGDDPDIHILPGMETAFIEINALQRASTVVIQKSIREGFALTVAEALWKKRPVVASAVGGIVLQIKHNVTGKLVHSVEGCAYAIKELLANPDLANKLGKNGCEQVKHNFLLTRHVKDYLLLALALERNAEGVVRL